MIRLIQSVVPHMASKKKGKIVNVESCIALDLGPWSGAYSASKADVHSFTDTLRFTGNQMQKKLQTKALRLIVKMRGHIMLYTHNWWHVALCCFEGHSPMEKVRDVYDQNISKELERSDASPAEVYLNAVGLLLRVYVRGRINVFGDCLKILAS
uniref:Uncharacterized protein LOC104244883 n=1 Tax=Nicotiana sylvestris TaxID=4096 RepID=A0A1U7Y6F3_NICSY|nr:PREDICTED: uncharacterized protein LOC104244883 [Nicotiana sylvestris]